MKRSTRIVSLMLVLLMLVGMMPLSLLAADGSSANGTGGGITEPDSLSGLGGVSSKTSLDALLESGIAQSDIIYYTDFNNRTAGKDFGSLSANSSDTSAAVFGSSGSNISVKSNSGSPAWKQVSDGNMALSFSDGVASSLTNRDVYFDVINKGVTGNGAEASKDIPNNRSFIFQVDVKRGDKILAGELIKVGERATFSSGFNSQTLVWVDANGRLYANSDNTETIGYLSTSRFTTIAVYVAPNSDSNSSRYWIYINGVNVNEAGYSFTTPSAGFRLTAIRCYQVLFGWNDSTGKDAGVQELSDDAMMFDNVQAYYVPESYTKDSYIALENENVLNGFAKKDNAVYYYCNNTKPSNYVYINNVEVHFDSQDRVLAENNISLLDYNQANTQALYHNGKKLYELNEFNDSTVGLSTKLASTVTFKDLKEHGYKIRMSVYTEGVQENTVLLVALNGGTAVGTNSNTWDSSQNAYKPLYPASYLSFGTTRAQGYKKDGNTLGNNEPGDAAATSGLNGWTTFDFNIGASRVEEFLKNQAAMDADTYAGSDTSKECSGEIKFIEIRKTGWGNLDYAYDKPASNGTQTRVVNADYNVYIASMELVGYGAPITSVEDVPVNGWINLASGGRLYRAHWSGEILKNTIAEVNETGEKNAYRFDANGFVVDNAATGVGVSSDNHNHYFKNGVMQFGDSSQKYVDPDTDVAYRITSDGVYCGAWIANSYSFDAAYPTTTASGTSYIFNKDFEGYTVGTVLTNVNSTNNSGIMGGVLKNALVKSVANGSGKAVSVYNYKADIDPFGQLGSSGLYDATDASSGTPASSVIDLDLMLGSDWNVNARTTMLSRYNTSGVYGQKDRTLFTVDSEGYVRIGNWGSLDELRALPILCKLSTSVYTKLSTVVTVSKNSDSTYSLYASYYVNGALLKSNVSLGSFNHSANSCWDAAKSKATGDGIRIMQIDPSTGTHGTYYIDNLRGYAGSTPEYVNNSVTLRNGLYLEGVDTWRYYENGAIANNKYVTITDESGKGARYYADCRGLISKNSSSYAIDFDNMSLPSGGGSIKYETEVSANAFFTNKLLHTNFAIPATVRPKAFHANYDSIMLEIYLPEYNNTGKPAPSEVIFCAGENERWYELNYDSATGTYSEKARLSSNPYGSFPNTNTKYITYTDGLTRETRIVQKDGKYYGRTYAYDATRFDFSKLNVGWNTIKISKSSGRDLEFITMNVSGWALNMTKPWYPEGKNDNGNTTFESVTNANYSVGFANLRLVKDNNIEYVDGFGWNEDNTSYISKETLEPLTGINRVDGVYYDFGTGTSATRLNGLYDYDVYTVANSKLVKSTEKKMFVNGKLLTVSKAGNTLTMDGMIGVNYYLNINEVPTDGTYVEFTVNGNTYTVLLKDLESKTEGYKATVYVPAAEMTKKISAVVKAENGTVIATLADYTAKEAAMAYVNGEFDDNVKAAAKAMLNYAAAAQVYFNVETTDLANKDLNEADKTVTVDTSSVSGNYAVSGSVTGATYRSSQLGLQAATVLYHNFDLAEGASIDDYTVTVSGGLTAEKELVGGKMRIKITGITASDLDTAYTVTVTSGDESVAVTYSATKYVQLVLANESQLDANLVSLAKALYSYNVAADAYVNANKTSGASLAGSDHTFLY